MEVEIPLEAESFQQLCSVHVSVGKHKNPCRVHGHECKAVRTVPPKQISSVTIKVEACFFSSNHGFGLWAGNFKRKRV